MSSMIMETKDRTKLRCVCTEHAFHATRCQVRKNCFQRTHSTYGDSAFDIKRFGPTRNVFAGAEPVLSRRSLGKVRVSPNSSAGTCHLDCISQSEP